MSLIKGFENICSIKDVQSGVVSLGSRQVKKFARCGDRTKSLGSLKLRSPCASRISGIRSRGVVTAALRNIDWCVETQAFLPEPG